MKVNKNFNINISIFFLLSFLVYFVPVNNINLSVPIFYILVMAIFEIFQAAKNNVNLAKEIIFSREMFGIIFIIPFLSCLGFIFGQEVRINNILNFLCIYIVGISSLFLLIKYNNPLVILMNSFYVASIISISIYFGLNFSKIILSLFSHERHTSFSFHFNLIAFILAGYSGAIIHELVNNKNRIINMILLLLSISIIISAQSRGSLFSIIIGIFFVFSTYINNAIHQKKINVLMLLLISIFFLLVLIFCFSNLDLYILIENRVSILLSYVDNQLSFSNKYRGFGTGFTGREDLWLNVFEKISLKDIIFGNGYRTSVDILGTIDNGYIVMLYENGIFSLSILTFNLINYFVKISKTIFSGINKNMAIKISLAYTILIFLSNCFVARFLFGSGNPFSAFIIMIIFVKNINVNKGLLEDA